MSCPARLQTTLKSGFREIRKNKENFIELYSGFQYSSLNQSYVNTSNKLPKNKIKLFTKCAISQEKWSLSQLFSS